MNTQNSDDIADLVKRLRGLAYEDNWDFVGEAADLLEAVRNWSVEEPDPDPKVDNPAMIGHFAGFQKARRVVQDLLGIGDPDVI